MDGKLWLSTVMQYRAIAVIRSEQFLQGLQMAHSVAKGGMRLIEVTWNSDRPGELIQQLKADLPNCQIGAGTLLTEKHMAAAITAGAQFLFTPHVNSALIQWAVSENIPIVAGALSPSEIMHAWELGASSVKVFPVQAVGGVEYIRSLQGPLGHIPLIPTGGVTVDNADDFLQAGAIGVGLAGSLFPTQAINQGNWQAICQRAADLTERLLAKSRVYSKSQSDEVHLTSAQSSRGSEYTVFE